MGVSSILRRYLPLSGSAIALRAWRNRDDVVDWVAVDGYNWDAPQYWQQNGNTWRLIDQEFRPSFDNIAS